MNDLHANSPSPAATQRGSPLRWAVFLACSWTWCIGMFLPVLLVRDYGVWGWVVFAVPNIVGAAAVGWVLRSPRTSLSIARDHYSACAAFSLVTLCFQMFFAATNLGLLLVTLAAIAVGAWLVRRVRRADGPLAALVYVVSLAAFAVVLWRGRMPLPPPRLPAAGAAFLLPVCALGFLLCPYLDLTFLRARTSLAQPQARIAFTTGFGLFFLLMILFTLVYTPAIRIRPEGFSAELPRPAAIALLLHISAQLAFTCVAHLDDLPGPNPRSGQMLRSAAAAMGGGCVLAVIATRQAPFIFQGIAGPEFIYRLFMAFYGLVFPAYVWICMLPRRGQPIGPPSAAAINIFVVSVLIAAPMYWMGFIEQRLIWLLPGVAFVLAARLALPAGRRPAQQNSAPT